jgi:IS5 family transposase
MPSFFLMGAIPQVQDTPTMKLHALLDWNEIGHKLKGLYRREFTHGGGPEPYDPLAMFKAMLLGQWHGLSDPQLEQALKVRIDFMVFTGFEPGMDFPDATTICRFRNRLVQAKLDQVLLRRINSQLERQGLKVAGARGAIIDATIIPSAARPNQHIEVPEEGEPQVVDSADGEARWVKKGNHAFYGYRGYAAVDSEDGYMEHVEVHPANESEVNKLMDVVDSLEPGVEAVLADKGYASQANREALKHRGMGDLIQHKAHKNKPLLPWQRQANRLIAHLRFKVEQAFGTLKRKFHLSRARYFGAAKVQAQMCWAALGMNLLKAHRKLQLMDLNREGAPA